MSIQKGTDFKGTVDNLIYSEWDLFCPVYACSCQAK